MSDLRQSLLAPVAAALLCAAPASAGEAAAPEPPKAAAAKPAEPKPAEAKPPAAEKKEPAQPTAGDEKKPAAEEKKPAEEKKGAPDKPAAEAKKPEGPKIPAAVEAELRKSLQAHIAETAEEHEGKYPIEDLDSEDTWSLNLKRLDPAGLRQVNPEEFILRAEFLDKADPKLKRADVPVVVDFTLAKVGGDWAVTDEAVYSAGGKPRFAYSEDHRRLPLNQGGDAAPGGADDGDSASEEIPLPPDPEDETRKGGSTFTDD